MIGVRSRSRSLQVGLGAAVLVAVAACGGAAPEAAAPSAPSPAAKTPDTQPGEPSTIEQAQDQIAAAKADLAASSGADKSSRYAPEPPSATTGSAPPPAAGLSRPSTAPRSTLPPPAEAPTGTTSCGGPCRALASMRRAVTALCRMTGAEDPRCVDAKRTLADSTGRIAPCSC
jgi:hypothetical protein